MQCNMGCFLLLLQRQANQLSSKKHKWYRIGLCTSAYAFSNGVLCDSIAADVKWQPSRLSPGCDTCIDQPLKQHLLHGEASRQSMHSMHSVQNMASYRTSLPLHDNLQVLHPSLHISTEGVPPQGVARGQTDMLLQDPLIVQRLASSRELPVHMPEDGPAALVKPAAVQLLAVHAGGKKVV